MNNIVAGAEYAGFTAMGHDCGDYEGSGFKNNVAHSVNGPFGGIGAIIFPDPAKSHSTCYEGSFFTGYKNTLQGVFHWPSDAAKTNIMSHMTLMDNLVGNSLFLGKPSEDYTVEFNHNRFFGELPIPDCPHAASDYCLQEDKFAMFPPAGHARGKSIHEIMESALPTYKVKSYASWGMFASTLKNNTFIGFK